MAKQHQEFVKTASEHAKRLKIAVVTDPDKDSKETIDKLSKLKGTDLDVAFLEWLIDGHKDTTVFDNEVKNGDDAGLKIFARNAIASGNEHLKEARALLTKLMRERGLEASEAADQVASTPSVSKTAAAGAVAANPR